MSFLSDAKQDNQRAHTRSWFLWIVVFLFFSCLSGQITATEQITQNTASEAERSKLLTLFSGEWVSRALYVATKMQIADHLHTGPKSIEELANLTFSHRDSLYRLLQMLKNFGIFQEVTPGVFANTESSHLLEKNHPDSLHALSLWYGEEIHASWENLLPSVQMGIPAFQLTFKQPVFPYFAEYPERASLFQEAMKEKSRAVIHSVLATYPFDSFTSVCDVGGGYGQFVQTLLYKYPHLSGILFELPDVIAQIRKQTPEIENDRCQLVPGDFFTSVPKGHDLYILKSVVHDWNDAQTKTIFKNCYEAMGPTSRLLIVEMVLQTETPSPYANCMDLLMMAITGGKERSLASFSHMLTASGFVLQQVYPTSTEFSILECVKKAEKR